MFITAYSGNQGALGRRRRRVYKPIKKVLPKIFGCPRCGSISVRVILQRSEALGDYYHVICGNPTCMLVDDITISQAKDIIDVYNLFVDHFNKKVIR